MSFIPVPEVAECKLIYSDDNQVCMNTLYFSFGATPSAADLTLLAADVGAWWGSYIAPAVCNVVFLDEVIATDMGSQFGAQGTADPVIQGGVTTEQAPNNASPCISFRTGFRGRSFRGRNYIVGLPNANLNVNIVDFDFQDAIRSAYQRLIDKTAGITNPAWDWCVVSRFSGVDTNGKPVPRTTGIFTFVSEVLFVDSVVDSQRRRLPKRGG